MRLNAVPTQNLPIKSHVLSKNPERRHLSVVNENSIAIETSESVYKSFSELNKRVGKLKLSDWDVKNTDTNISLKQFLHPYIVLKLEVIIDSTFN